MEIKVLMTALCFMSFSAIAEVKTLAHDVKGSSEVTVKNMDETACVLNYKNSDYLTSEGMPVFYTFQAELKGGELVKGMQSWLPHGIKPGQPSVLSFHDKSVGKIYEYTDTTSTYGELFFKNNLFRRFLSADKILMTQSGVIISMPVYKKSEISDKVTDAFNRCVDNLDYALTKYCRSSNDAAELCKTKKAMAKNLPVSEVIKDDPEFIIAAKLKALEEASTVAASTSSVATNVTPSKAVVAPKKSKLTKEQQAKKAAEEKKAFEAAVAEEVAKAMRKSRERAATLEKAALARAEAEKNKKEILIFGDSVEKPYRFKKFGKNITAQYASGGTRGKLLRLKYGSDTGMTYFTSTEGIDYSEYKYIQFDVKLLADPQDKSKLNVKMDCFEGCTSGPYPIDKPRLGQWMHYKISLQDLVNHPGSNLDLTNVNIPFSILPDWGHQKGVKIMLDQVILTNY